MESDIIVEGFKRSIEMHGVKYMRLIGDGDSSIYKKLIETRPYGSSLVEKIECSNHLLRNFSKHLRELNSRKRSVSKNLPVPPYLRKIVTARSYRLVAAIKKAVQHRSSQEGDLTQQIELLIKDIKNAPSHVFGEHKLCEEINYFKCQKDSNEINYVDTMSACGLYEDIVACFKRLVDNAFSLILNMTNNWAEQYNSIICKFVGGKRINYSLKRSYQTRCEAAAISFNCGNDYLKAIHKKLVQRSPYGATKKFIERIKRRREYYEKAKFSKRRLFKKRKIAVPDQHYGADVIQAVPDLTKEEYSFKAEIFLKNLQKTPDEIKKIEEKTRGQAGNPLWFKERVNRITASNFKSICSMRKTTSTAKKVANLLYRTFTGNQKTRYGRRNEIRAIHDFTALHHLKVQNCGFFIDPVYYMLGASPDGIIGSDAIVEIKCPASAANVTPIDAIRSKIIKYAQLKENALNLKRNHAYYYQIQGQLHITSRNVCYFVIWTPLGILVEKIYRDDEFWNTKMVEQLKSFYYKCLLPEIIDSRKARGMDLRDSPTAT